MSNTAYAVGVAIALKEAGLVKIALSDDTDLNDTGQRAQNPAEEIEAMIKSIEIPTQQRIMPDNITKITGKDFEVGSNWGPQGSPSSSGTFNQFDNSSNNYTLGSGY